MKDLTNYAVEVATGLGATYADARLEHSLHENLMVRNGKPEGISSTESEGLGVRVIVNGAWGFAASDDLSKAGLEATAKRAVAIAKASALAKSKPVELAPLAPEVAEWVSPCQQDPFAVPLEAKLALLLETDKLMQAAGASLTEAELDFLRVEKHFASSEGACIAQRITHSGGGLVATAIEGDELQTRSYPAAFGGDIASAGWEFVEAMDLLAHAEELTAETHALLAAPPCPEGEMDLILTGSQLALQVHESCGHPIELDRVLGTEASFAGRSFLTLEKLGNFIYGSPLVNITADATIPGALGSFGYDDEGVPAQCVDIVKEGRFVGYLSSRETAPVIGQTSGGAMRADSWGALPLIRMTNINLLPGDSSLAELISGIKYGVLMDANKSWSIDDHRLNFQFGCELGRVIRDGKLAELVKNPVYTGITPEFWGACDGIAGPAEWRVWGVPNCGKGEPMQVARVAHGTSPARFRKVHITCA